MTPNPSPEQQIVGCSLSNYLADRRQRIVSEWMASVLSDPAVPAADKLTVTQLKDHIPQILDDLSRTLEDAFNQEVKDSAKGRAAIHGHIRWEQHFDISQLIREISGLRTVLICHLAEFHDARIPNFSGELGLFTMVVLHSFLDRLIRISVEQFIATGNTTERRGQRLQVVSEISFGERKSMSRLEAHFLALVAIQSAHSIEEYLGRLWEMFPPAIFLTGLISNDRRIGFIGINTALVAFGLWCFFWPVRRRWPSARLLIGVWVLIELINGIGHLMWSIQQRGYTPGVITAPLLLVLALSLMWQIKEGTDTFPPS